MSHKEMMMRTWNGLVLGLTVFVVLGCGGEPLEPTGLTIGPGKDLATVYFSDECQADEYRCDSGWCIPAEWICDVWEDCESGEDEVGCDGNQDNQENEQNEQNEEVDQRTLLFSWTKTKQLQYGPANIIIEVFDNYTCDVTYDDTSGTIPRHTDTLYKTGTMVDLEPVDQDYLVVTLSDLIYFSVGVDNDTAILSVMVDLPMRTADYRYEPIGFQAETMAFDKHEFSWAPMAGVTSGTCNYQATCNYNWDGWCVWNCSTTHTYGSNENSVPQSLCDFANYDDLVESNCYRLLPAGYNYAGMTSRMVTFQ